MRVTKYIDFSQYPDTESFSNSEYAKIIGEHPANSIRKFKLILKQAGKKFEKDKSRVTAADCAAYYDRLNNLPADELLNGDSLSDEDKAEIIQLKKAKLKEEVEKLNLANQRTRSDIVEKKEVTAYISRLSKEVAAKLKTLVSDFPAKVEGKSVALIAAEFVKYEEEFLAILKKEI